MRNLVYFIDKIDALRLHPYSVPILIIFLLLPLWILEWTPINLQKPPEEITKANVDLKTAPKQSEETNSVLKSLPRLPLVKKIIITSGDTMMDIFTRAGLNRGLAHKAIVSLSKIYDPKNILPGQEFNFFFKQSLNDNLPSGYNQSDKLIDIIYKPNLYHEYRIVSDKKNQFKAQLYKRNIKTIIRRINGSINSSLYLAATKLGLPIPVLMELIRIYSWDIDFQRSIRSGDTFDVLYERKETSSGKLARFGNIIYADLKLGKLSNKLYIFKTNKNSLNHFDKRGHSAKKALMRTPINGARLSSGYGTRRHPILGFNKMHRGVDFAAPIGTPILAAGSGTIVYRSRNGAYGNYVRIRHNSIYSTAYAHLSKFSRSLTKGSRVRQGQVIGYVGTTGRSTGPHLHYEILKRGRQTNPMRVKMPSGTRLSGGALKRFQDAKAKIQILLQTERISPKIKQQDLQ